MLSPIDDYLKLDVYLLTHKSEALEKFKQLMKSVETHQERPTKGLNTGRGGEYKFKDICKDNGLRHSNTML